VAEAWRRAAAAWEKTGLETWTFEALPERVAVAEKDGLSVSAYPGLRVEPGGVALRLFPTPEEARRGLDRALEHMFAHELRYELSWLDRDLKDVARLGPLAASLGPVATLKEHVREHLRRFLCGRRVEPLERAAFLRVAAEARAECKGLLFRLLDRLQPILQLRLELAVAAEKPPYSGFERDLARLVPPDLLLRTSYEMLPEIPRYLRAMQARVRKARENPVRDRQRAAAVARLEQRVSAADKAGRLNPAVREKVSWMLEEWRVSVFAQEIGTAFPVSEKRIEKLLAGD
jgi:ATP-dependent helicase HrpA